MRDGSRASNPAALPVRLYSLIVLALVAGLCCAAASPGFAEDPVAEPNAKAEAGGKPENPFPRRSKAPGLEGGVEWLNTSGEITLNDLRGKVVLLDFWTYCCINCMHVLPDLAFLEKKYANELVVIGVHSAKFDNEKDSENIRQAIVRYEIEHPVINDAEMHLWRKFGTRSWPTLVLIDPEGYYCGFVSGEGQGALLDEVVGKVVDYHRAKGTLDESPVRFNLEREKLPATPLRYPGKILADEAGNRLFVSDSNHNRIVVSSLDGQLIDVIGNGAIGADDGNYETATFDHPQGMELVGDTLYVADTENHLIRTVDLAQKTVWTLAGTGEQDRERVQGGALRNTALNSPWDLLHHNGTLYVAMAGPHQLWKHVLGSRTIEAYAGTGREDIIDGPRGQSAFAQPSGLASDGQNLYVADSEGSSIRRVPFSAEGEVTTVVGTSNLPGGRALFEFGDIDGTGSEARLQHPLGVAFDKGLLYVADSYNHKIKRIVLTSEKGESNTYLGNGRAGDALDPLQLSEPAGIDIAGGKLFIADTNNHRIVTVDLGNKQAAVLEIAGLNPPQPPARQDKEDVAAGDAQAIEAQTIAPAEQIPVVVNVTLPDDFKLNDLAPVTCRVAIEGDQTLFPAEILGKRQKGKIEDGQLTFAIPATGTDGAANVEVAVTYGYCRGGTGGLCKLATSRFKLPLEVKAGAETKRIELKATAE